LDKTGLVPLLVRVLKGHINTGVLGGAFRGCDVLGTETSMSSGLMAGKRGIDGNNAAYDMKSLGRHIKAVSKKI
jgi:hypothetical protein